MREITIEQFQSFLNKGITQDTIEKALNKGCIVVEYDAKKRCPVGKTGLLRNSIRHWVEPNTNEGYVGTRMSYAPYVEYGTGIYARDGDGRQTPWVYRTADGEFYFTEGQKPQPYIEPALEENVNEINRVMLQTITSNFFKK